VAVQQVSAAIREDDGDVLSAFERHRANQTLLAEMAQVTLTEVERMAVVVALTGIHGIAAGAAATAETGTGIVPVAGIVTPAGIVEHGGAPP
jgi:hypothetical protein